MKTIKNVTLDKYLHEGAWWRLNACALKREPGLYKYLQKVGILRYYYNLNDCRCKIDRYRDCEDRGNLSAAEWAKEMEGRSWPESDCEGKMTESCQREDCSNVLVKFTVYEGKRKKTCSTSWLCLEIFLRIAEPQLKRPYVRKKKEDIIEENCTDQQAPTQSPVQQP